MADAERALLHRGGRAGTWGSLGLWHEGVDDYAGACAALARAVGQAAGIRPGDRVLSLACGAGDELLLWAREFGAAEVLGLELDPRLVAAARGRVDSQARGLGGAREDPAPLPRGCRIEVRQADLRQLARAGGAAAGAIAPGQLGSFDCVVCVDAAYWLGPRATLWRSVAPLLRPGGRLAYTDLCLGAPRQPAWRWALRGAAALARVPLADVPAAEGHALALRQAGLVHVRAERLDALVLAGFAAHVRNQEPRIGRTALHPDWRRPGLTARLIGPCRAAGLGYVLMSGERLPGNAAATATAERTALSSSGTPVSA
jgi:SAM-dependent methyltransferase